MEAQMLAGKTAIITGASYGMGETMATLFAEEGARVVLTARGKVFAVLTTVGCILLLFVTTAYLVDSTFSPFLYFIF